MDLLSSIRKSGSRGGVNFSWEDVQTSQHRENYLGHSLMAPVGRWAKNKDLGWYAKGDDDKTEDGETAEERRVRERKEEIRKIKEAEEDALAAALGLPAPDRGTGTGANGITVGEMNKVIKESGVGDEELEEVGKQKGFGGGGRLGQDVLVKTEVIEGDRAGLNHQGGERNSRAKDQGDSREKRHRRHRPRSRSGERRRRESRSPDRRRHRYREDREGRRGRSRSPERKERRYRSRSPGKLRPEREDRDARRDGGHRRPMSRSPDRRDRGDRRNRARDFR